MNMFKKRKKRQKCIEQELPKIVEKINGERKIIYDLNIKATKSPNRVTDTVELGREKARERERERGREREGV